MIILLFLVHFICVGRQVPKVQHISVTDIEIAAVTIQGKASYGNWITFLDNTYTVINIDCVSTITLSNRTLVVIDSNNNVFLHEHLKTALDLSPLEETSIIKKSFYWCYYTSNSFDRLREQSLGS